jgi:hypothetical protein
MSKSPPTETKRAKHFTAFRSAAEEAAMKDEQDVWENEGGHMSSTKGRIVRAPGNERPYKVILSHADGAESERAFATMREAEAFIRRCTPAPPTRRTLYDRDAPGDWAPRDRNLRGDFS